MPIKMGNRMNCRAYYLKQTSNADECENVPQVLKWKGRGYACELYV